MQPGRKAPLGEWLAYYQRSAALYAEIAEIDSGHGPEARYWAQWERRRAEEIAAQLSSLEPRESQRRPRSPPVEVIEPDCHEAVVV
jgi:hypothetical protein